MAFPPAAIEVGFNTFPSLVFALETFRNEVDPTGLVDTTGYEFELVVNDGEEELFRVQGTVTAVDVTFDLTQTHTGYPPGAYDAELRWWDNPGSPRGFPLDSVPIRYQITASVGRSEI